MLNIISSTESYDLIEYNVLDKGLETNKIAGFDLDNTLIITKSGFTFASNSNDWKFKYNNIKEEFKKLIDNNYRIVIITNQLGVLKGKTTKDDLYSKILYISRELELNITWIALYQDDIYRKPRIKSLDLLVDNLDKTNSFYCGDACGRKNDFSDTDYKFALNAGIKIYSDNYYFNKFDDSHEYSISLHPIVYTKEYKDLTTMVKNKLPDREVILMIGSMASGKSTFCKTYFSDYEIINQDELKTIAKCKNKVLNTLNNTNKNIIIDNTNRNIKTRKYWIDLFHKNNIKINMRYIYLNVPKSLALHINTYRTLLNQKKIPKVAIHTFYKQYEAPTTTESSNIVEIIILPFYLNESIIDMNLFKMFLE